MPRKLPCKTLAECRRENRRLAQKMDRLREPDSDNAIDEQSEYSLFNISTTAEYEGHLLLDSKQSPLRDAADRDAEDDADHRRMVRRADRKRQRDARVDDQDPDVNDQDPDVDDQDPDVDDQDPDVDDSDNGRPKRPRKPKKPAQTSRKEVRSMLVTQAKLRIYIRLLEKQTPKSRAIRNMRADLNKHLNRVSALIQKNRTAVTAEMRQKANAAARNQVRSALGRKNKNNDGRSDA